MAYTTLQLTQDEVVLTITANRPEVRNVQSRLKSDRTDSRGGETAVHGRSSLPHGRGDRMHGGTSCAGAVRGGNCEG
jgi:hypothetical protein